MKPIQHRVRHWFNWLLLLSLAATLSHCKREDTDPPAVAISSPSDGFQVIADSEFTIAGVASDDQGLSSITATIYEAVTEQVIGSKTVSVSGLSATFNFKMSAGDRYTPFGQYTLRVVAMDAGRNVGAASTLMGIQALPLVYLGAVWAGDQGGNRYGLFVLDSATNVVSGQSGLEDLTGMLADNRNQQLVTVQSAPSFFRLWSIDRLDPLFESSLPVGTGTASYTGVTMNQSKYFCSLQSTGYLQGYRFDGMPLATFGDASYPATAVYASADYVYAGLQAILGAPMKLDAYDAISRSLRATEVLDWPAKGILSLNDAQILVWGNLGNNGQLLVLDRKSLQRDEELVLSGSIVGAATANDRAWILTTAGVYEFYPSNGTLSASLVTGSYTAIAVDATLNRLFLGGNGIVEIRSGAGVLQGTIPGGFGQVKFIDMRYNK
jgi:hypothetical protein